MPAWRRASIFGPGERQPLDRNGRARFLFLVRQHRRPGGLSSGHHAEALVRLLGTDGRLDPSHSFLARLAAVSEATVQRALDRLRALGLLSWQRRLVRTRWGCEQTSSAYALRPEGQIAGPVEITRKKEAGGGGSGAVRAMLEAARGLPDLLKARREALEARWRAAMAARMG